MNKTISIPGTHSFYCLSYDIISKKVEKGDKDKEHLELKSDIVWEILVTHKYAQIISPVSSTILFESPEELKYWEKVLDYFKTKMNFVLTTVNQFYISEDGTKHHEIYINEVEDLNSHFHRDIVDPTIIDYNKIKSSVYAGKPKSKVLKE